MNSDGGDIILATQDLDATQLHTHKNKQWWRNPVINRRAWTWEDANNMTHNGQWWQHAVLYQIYPWSFKDKRGNGAGDLKGIISKMDYLASLGVDALWLSPIFESPMNDLGYDITDMLNIDPLFGDMKDFQTLLKVAHSVGLKVIIDQVWNHTSDQHPWFIESRKSRDNSKADWYVWADPREDGSPPNNWLSAFMGESAWHWDEQREQYYYSNFLPSQPDLNWHNPDVREAIFNRAKFWLDQGVDGFRLDAVNFFLHDQHLRDNPPRQESEPLPDGTDPENPLVTQKYFYSFCRPETLEILKPIRELVDQYSGVVLLGEVTMGEDSVALSSEYVAGEDHLHLAYNSVLLEDEPISASKMKQIVERVQRHFRYGGQCWMVGNHDYGRLRSRWTGCDQDGEPYPKRFYHMIAALLFSLPGAFCLYQGDELGIPEAKIPKDIPEGKIRDPFGQAMYPLVPGRDGSRTPMPWEAEETNAGFTSAEESWLPIPRSHHYYAVDLQNAAPDSMLNTWRRLLHWRKQQPALIAGNCTLLETEEPLFGFIREYAEQRLLCLFNLSDENASYQLHQEAICESLSGLGCTVPSPDNRLTIEGYGYYFANLI
ncbi:alpha glucosidase [Spirulina sp. CS-785/01]|uniref:alpha-glucosidase n=1 Tax=Spirulina sp. CS-785/01 TaxID=3021716 RepID=UPI00232BC704|nr:alpha-glucosidase [Spirulina sp. CS-785/01]MDB9314768.1 alpha glucosidase [Spirulina sp. CS-785/01]